MTAWSCSLHCHLSVCMEASSRQLVWQQKKHDSRVYCADDVAQPAGDDVLITDADDRQCRRATQQSVGYFGALLCRHRWTVTANLYWTRSATSSQCKSACKIRISPQSYLRVTDKTCCSVQHTLQFVCHRPWCTSVTGHASDDQCHDTVFVAKLSRVSNWPDWGPNYSVASFLASINSSAQGPYSWLAERFDIWINSLRWNPVHWRTH